MLFKILFSHKQVIIVYITLNSKISLKYENNLLFVKQFFKVSNVIINTLKKKLTG